MIKGLDKLQRHLAEAQSALQALDGELCTVSINPNDPVSIEAAIQRIANVIDERVGGYAANPIIRPLAEQMKERYRDNILERAAAARLSAEKE